MTSAGRRAAAIGANGGEGGAAKPSATSELDSAITYSVARADASLVAVLTAVCRMKCSVGRADMKAKLSVMQTYSFAPVSPAPLALRQLVQRPHQPSPPPGHATPRDLSRAPLPRLGDAGQHHARGWGSRADRIGRRNPVRD
jgi:hypothetical protein